MKINNISDIILYNNEKDDRLRVLENGMTKYGCKSIFYPHISYSSCTASTISMESYIYIQDFYKNKNFDDQEIVVDEFEKVSSELKEILDLNDSVDIYFGSSGTDLEMLPYLFIPKYSKVNNIVIAPNEVGSGTLLASQGKIFFENREYEKGSFLKGFDKFQIKIFNINIRKENGDIVSDDIVTQRISKVLKSSRDSYNIVHLVFHSKTGLIKPLPENLLNLEINSEKTIIVIDACQFRISKETLKNLLSMGYMVFITGSKFFAGPTFSAAALIPSSLKKKLQSSEDIPTGLNFLFGKEMFPQNLESVSNFEYINNIGLLLRWRVAIFEMKLFYNIYQENIKKTINIFNEVLLKIIKKYPCFVVYSDWNKKESDYDKLMSNTIITIGFKDKNLDFDKAKEIYQKLINGELLKKGYSYSLHLGQPVKIIKYKGVWIGTLRIALSSRFFVANSNRIEDLQKELISTELNYIFSAIKEFI